MTTYSANRTNSIQEAIELMNERRLEFHTMTIPTAKWKIFRECNYQCPYCTVWQDRSEDPSPELAKTYAKAVSDTISGSWRVYLTGGELTIRRRTTEAVVNVLGARGHELRIISNFSSPVEYYLRLLEISDGRITSIFLTRHRKYGMLEPYTARAIELRSRLPVSCELLVRQVVETSSEGIRDFQQCRQRLADGGVELYPLRLVEVENGRKKLADYIRHDIRKDAARIFASYPNLPDRQGTYCPAGFEYIYINPRLDVYTCIPYTKRANGFLGNCLSGAVKLREKPMLCGCRRCYCVPGR